MKIGMRHLPVIIGTAIGFLLVVSCGGAGSTSALDVAPLETATPPAPEARTATAVVAPGTISDGIFIQLEDPLDEPEYYCVDVPGAGRGVMLQAPLQAHTCKAVEVAEDELFSIGHPLDGQIYMKAYDLCVVAESPEADSLLRLETCSDSALQRFSFESDGQIRLQSGAAAGLCLAVAPGPGTPTGGPSHLRLDLNLQRCDEVDPHRAIWITR